DGQVFVAKTVEEAAAEATQQNGKSIYPADLKQDEDVLDTWFSSWLWPISVFDGIRNPDNPEIKYYYPTNDLVTAPDILFFWVARMVMAGWEYRKDIPFRNVYFTGMVRDKLGRKMSKSLGNSPDPIELLNKYGADGVRMGMMLMSPAGNDLLFDESLCEQGRNFSNKIWNALRLIKNWNEDETLPQPAYSELAANWFDAKLNQSIENIENHFDKFRISDALMAIYKLIWDDFSSIYLEVIKPPFGEPIDVTSKQQAIGFMGSLMKILHPFMPFITEELWHSLASQPQGAFIAVEPAPKAQSYNQHLIHDMDFVSDIINGLRNARNTGNISQKQLVQLMVITGDNTPLQRFGSLICKLGSLSQISFPDKKPEGAISFMVRTCECYIPVEQRVDTAEVLAKLHQDLDYQRGFLNSVRRKLENEKFMLNARPQVVEAERQKESDALLRIKAIEAQLSWYEETSI
ncbi:MAG TPA: class I tRNA ligase family protein, partial [Bacteroidales bacterium]|nr:class I tRNA ligase family protein [Bacteroidales bacterium]